MWYKENYFKIYLALFLFIASIIVLLRLHSLGEPLERDLTSYAYIAHQIMAGDKLYTSLWDHKPPGLYSVFMLAELLWGYNSSAIVYLGIVFTLISLLFLFLFLKRIAGVYVALIGSLFWALASNSVLLQANQPNVEVFLNTFTLIAIWSFTKYHGGKSKYLLLTGLSFAVASFFKMIAIFPLATLCFYLIFQIPAKNTRKWIKESIYKLTILLLPVVLIWIINILYFGLQGRFGDFWNMVVTFNRHYSGNLLLNVWGYFINPQLFFHGSLKEIWVLVALSFAWLPLGKKMYGPLRRSFFIFLLFGIWIAVASPGKYYPHYYQLLLPIFSIMSALFFSDLFEHLKIKKRITRVGTVFLLLLFSSFYLLYYQIVYLKMTPIEISHKKYGAQFVQAYDLAKYIRTVTRNCDTVYEWGAETGIYYYSKRRSASGIFHVYPLLGAPYEVRTMLLKRVFEDISVSPPSIFVWNDRYGKLDNSIFSGFIREKYNLMGRSKEYAIYEYKLKDIGGDKEC